MVTIIPRDAIGREREKGRRGEGKKGGKGEGEKCRRKIEDQERRGEGKECKLQTCQTLQIIKLTLRLYII